MVDFTGKNYYEMLGLEKNATKRDIKIAYRELSQIYHPDSHFYDDIIDESAKGDYSVIFSQLTEAFHTLYNDDTRAEYDQTLAREANNQAMLGSMPEWTDESMMEKTRHSSNVNKYNLKTFNTFGKIDPSLEEEEETQPPVEEKKSFFQKLKSKFTGK